MLAPAPETAPTPQRVRAMLVDDNADDRALFAHAFQRCGPPTSLDTAATAEDAIRRLSRASGAPDVIFVDLHLPGLSAEDFTRWVKEQPALARALVIGITGDLSRACTAPREFGAGALLMKPIDGEDLAAMVSLVQATRSEG